MPSCAVYRCRSYLGAKNSTISFDRIPNPTTDVGEKWLNFLRHSRNDSKWVPSKSAVVCCKHFTPDSFYGNCEDTRTLLKNASVPTILPPSMTSKVPCGVKQKLANRKTLILSARLNSAGAGDNASVVTDPVEISDDDAETTGNDAETTDDDAKTTDAMVYIPGSDEVAMPLLMTMDNFKMDPLDSDQIPVNIVSTKKTVATVPVKPEPDFDRSEFITAYHKLLERTKKLEKTLARTEKVSAKRRSAIKTLQTRNSRLNKTKDELKEKLKGENVMKIKSFNGKHLIIKDNMIVMNLSNKPLVKRFLSSQRVCKGRKVFELR